MARYGVNAVGRRARLLKWTVFAIMAAMVLSQLLYAFGPNLGLLRFQTQSEYARLPALAGLMLRGGAALAWFLSFWFLARLLTPLEAGEFFTAALTRNLRAFAGFLALALGIPGVAAPLVGFIAGSCPSSGPCIPAVEINIRTILLMIVAVLLFLIARLLDEARRIDEDNRQIV